MRSYGGSHQHSMLCSTRVDRQLCGNVAQLCVSGAAPADGGGGGGGDGGVYPTKRCRADSRTVVCETHMQAYRGCGVGYPKKRCRSSCPTKLMESRLYESAGGLITRKRASVGEKRSNCVLARRSIGCRRGGCACFVLSHAMGSMSRSKGSQKRDLEGNNVDARSSRHTCAG